MLAQASEENSVGISQMKFVAIKVKKQNYCGKPAIVVQASDVSEKLHQKIIQLQRKELHAKTKQTEFYLATVSHEMRTPLLSVIFLLKQVISILNKAKQTIESNQRPREEMTAFSKELAQAIKYCSLMLSQIILIESFVEDLLDLKQMQAGVFNLTQQPIRIQEVLENICSIFEP